MRVNSFFHVAFGNSASKGQDKAVTRCIVAIFTLLLGIIGLFVMHQQDPLGWRVMNSCLSVGRSLVLFDLWGQWSGMRIRNGFQGTKGHSLRKKPTEIGFYIEDCQGEQIFHTKCKLHAGPSNCILRSREQDTEGSHRTAFWFLASADIRRHPKGQTITQGRELAVWGVQSLPGA